MLRVTGAVAGLTKPKGNIEFSQRELANMVGGTRESVNKCLRVWQRDGIVQVIGRSIIIKNRAALDQIADQV
jgi:CRP-like cAMP-binding protein